MYACKSCHSARCSDYYQENRDRLRAINKQWYEDNKEHALEYGRQYRQEHAEELAEYFKKYHQENKEVKNKRSKRWYEENKERVRKLSKKRYRQNRKKILRQTREWARRNPTRVAEIKRRYKARKRNADGDHTPEEWIQLCQEFDERCVCCLEQVGIGSLTADHIRPLAWGNSTHNIDNIQPLCASCNASKRDLHDTNYMLDFEKRLESYLSG